MARKGSGSPRKPTTTSAVQWRKLTLEQQRRVATGIKVANAEFLRSGNTFTPEVAIAMSQHFSSGKRFLRISGYIK